MKKSFLFFVAALLLLGTTQCKKDKPNDANAEVFTLKATIEGGDGKSISPNGVVTWNEGDKIFMYKAGTTQPGIVLTHQGSGIFRASGTGVYNGTYHFYYLGSNPPSTAPNPTSAYVMDLDNVNGTLADVERCNLRTALNVSVTNNSATATFRNQIAIGYFDLRHDYSYVSFYGNALYGSLSVNLSTGACTATHPVVTGSGNDRILLDCEAQSFYLPLVPTPDGELAVLKCSFGNSQISSSGSIEIQYQPGGQENVRFERNKFYCTSNFAPINLLADYEPSATGTSLSNVNATSATVTYTVAQATQSSSAMTATGLCYGTQANPTTSDAHVDVENPSYGEHSLNLTGLLAGTTYYVRPYATNAYGTAYGPQEVFATTPPPTGSIRGLFSVSATKQVYFSQGNLQYQASSDTWRFALNQWDFVGCEYYGNQYGNVFENGVQCFNNYIASDYTGWIDAFGWGTSGQPHNDCYQPWSTSTTASDYYAYRSSTANLYDSPGTADWGYNTISNGGTGNPWRTLKREEWNYLLNSRPNYNEKFGFAMVNGVKGMVLLPDNWTLPNGYSFTYGLTASPTTYPNTYTEQEWAMMQANGAVFLPTSYPRVGTSFNGDNMWGVYWSSSKHYLLSFAPSRMLINNATSSICNGISVRLVQDYQPTAK